MSDAVSERGSESEVEALRRRLDESASELQDFIYIVSHDFRGPLRAIMSSSMILLEDYSDVLDAEGKSELKRQSEAARKLNRLLEELLNLSRLNRQELQPTAVDLGEISERICNAKGLDSSCLRLEGDLGAIADEALMEKCLSHLIENSIKFSKGGVKPQMTLGRDGGGFYLKDEGIGLDPARADRVFLPFERLNGDEYAGIGMGLAAVKRIIQRHQGKVSADGSPGNGTTIRFTLPA